MRPTAVDIGDVRRLGVTVLTLGSGIVVFLLFLFLHARALFTWALPRAALARMGLEAWLWTGAGILLVLLGTLAAIVYGVPQPDPRKGVTRRQVQCQDCKAVFWIPDNGARPLQHPCPSCKALGVYDGRQPPVGKPPVVRPEKIVEIGLTCRNCKTRFMVHDTGVRPLKVTCIKCQAIGTVL